MRVLGVDISTYTGLVRLDDDGESMGKCVNYPGMKGLTRLQSIAQEVGKTIDLWAPDIVVIEGFAFANKNSLVLLVECATVVKTEIHKRGLEWYIVPPTVLKKWTTGNGAAKKELVAAKVFERWGFRSPSDDIVDAYALARMGQLGAQGLLSIKGVERGA